MEVYDRGMRLRALRKKCKMTQLAVAGRLEVTRATISNYESNVQTPRTEHLERLAILYRTSTDYILGLDNRPCVYLDGFTKSQQKFISNLVDGLREEFKKGTP